MTLRSRVDELGKEPRLRLDKKTYEYEVSLWQIIRDYQTLLDRAIMGLEHVQLCSNGQHATMVADETLADIRKQLDGGGDGN